MAPACASILLIVTIQAVPALGAERRCGGMRPTIIAKERDRVTVGTDGDDVILGSSGRDVIRAGAGDDIVCGRDDSDILGGGRGDDRIIDSLSSRFHRQILMGGGGSDRIFGARSLQRGGPGADVLRCGGQSFGDRGNDRIVSTETCHEMSGGPGDDVLEATVDEFVFADYRESPNRMRIDLAAGIARGWGLDTLLGVSNAYGSRHADSLLGTRRTNYLNGGGGKDSILGGRGEDWLEGEGGDDKIGGNRGPDHLGGGTGTDVLTGGGGRDICGGGERVRGCE